MKFTFSLSFILFPNLLSKRHALYCLYAIFLLIISACQPNPIEPAVEVIDIPTSQATEISAIISETDAAPTYTLRPTLEARNDPTVTAAPTIAADATETATPIARNTIVPATPIQNIRLPGKPLPVDLKPITVQTFPELAQIAEVNFDANVRDLAFSTDQTLLAIGLSNGAIKLWRVQDGFEGGELAGYISDITELAFSADGNLLAALAPTGEIKVWQVAKGNIDWQLLFEMADTTAQGDSQQLAFDADGNLQTIADNLIVWSMEDGTELESQPVPADVTLPVSYLVENAPDGVTADDPLKLWVGANYVNLIAESDPVETFAEQTWEQAITASAFIASENLLLIGTDDGVLHLQDISEAALDASQQLTIENGALSTLTLNDNQTFIAAAVEQTLLLFGVEQ